MPSCQPLLAVCLALLLITAGCSALNSDGESPTTMTTAEITETTITAQSATSHPPGISEAGVENASAIFNAHQSALRNHSFTARFNRTTLAANGSVLSRETGRSKWRNQERH